MFQEESLGPAGVSPTFTQSLSTEARVEPPASAHTGRLHPSGRDTGASTSQTLAALAEAECPELQERFRGTAPAAAGAQGSGNSPVYTGPGCCWPAPLSTWPALRQPCPAPLRKPSSQQGREVRQRSEGGDSRNPQGARRGARPPAPRLLQGGRALEDDGVQPPRAGLPKTGEASHPSLASPDVPPTLRLSAGRFWKTPNEQRRHEKQTGSGHLLGLCPGGGAGGHPARAGTARSVPRTGCGATRGASYLQSPHPPGRQPAPPRPLDGQASR